MEGLAGTAPAPRGWKPRVRLSTPQPRVCCEGGHRTPDDAGQQPAALPLSYLASAYRHGVLTPGFRSENPADYRYPMAANGVHSTCCARCAGRTDPQSRRSDSNGRHLPSEGSALDPLSYGESRAVPGARLELTTGASHAPVLSRTPPGWEGGRRAGLHQTGPGDACGTRTRDLRIDNPLLDQPSSRANVCCRSLVGLAGFEPAPSAPRTPRASICATTRHRPLGAGTALGREGTIPHLLVQSQVCFRLHHSRMWRPASRSCAPGDSNSDPRGKNPLGFPLPQRRRGAGGESRTLNGPSPPGSEPGASTDFRHARTAHRVIQPVILRVRCRGPRRARTVTSLRARELHCLSCSGPEVRGTGFEPAVPEGAWVTARCRPETASRGRIGACTSRQGMARPRSAYWRSLQFSRIYFGATQ